MGTPFNAVHSQYPSKICGVVLCGGKSSRFGKDKCWHVVQGKPLITHAVESLTTKLNNVWLGCKVPNRQFASLGLPMVSDPPAMEGPLAALAASLARAQQQGDFLLSFPVDCYPCPQDLLENLTQALAQTENAQVAIASCEGKAQYTLGLWRSELAPLAMECLKQGKNSMRSLLAMTQWVRVEFTQLHNINRPEDVLLFCNTSNGQNTT